jgi:glycosyltransferase involved in cell wall biosynthesis
VKPAEFKGKPLVPAPLSAVVITLNAASQLEACLASVAFAEEILVVDSGSTDGTVELARARGARVIRTSGSAMAAEAFAVAQAAHDWVLCIDADERVSDALRARSSQNWQRRALRLLDGRCNRFMGRWLHGEGYPDRNTRSSIASTRAGATTRCTSTFSRRRRWCGSRAT